MFPAAAQWAKEVAGYINANFTDTTVTVYIELFGDVGNIHWYADLENLTEMDRLNAWTFTDQGYQARLRSGAEFFIPGSTHDTLAQMF
jgi:hypothetical protein